MKAPSSRTLTCQNGRGLSKSPCPVPLSTSVRRFFLRGSSRIDKAKSAKAKRKAERNAPHVQEADLKSDHKRSRDDMSVDERESFDEWIRDIRNKRYSES